jgi:hypothetical protein
VEIQKVNDPFSYGIPEKYLQERADIPEEAQISFAVMNGSGDTKIMWDSRNEDETDHAKKTFADFKAKGFAIFKVNEKTGEKEGAQVDTFDPKAGKYIFVPPMRGG